MAAPMFSRTPKANYHNTVCGCAIGVQSLLFFHKADIYVLDGCANVLSHPQGQLSQQGVWLCNRCAISPLLSQSRDIVCSMAVLSHPQCQLSQQSLLFVHKAEIYYARWLRQCSLAPSRPVITTGCAIGAISPLRSQSRVVLDGSRAAPNALLHPQRQ